jgi:hypothetical protein
MKNEPILNTFISDLLTSKGTYNISKLLIEKLQSFEKAVLLTYYIDKYKQFAKKSNFDGWFYAIHEKQTKTLFFSLKKIRKLKQELIEMGFLHTKTIGIPSKQWFSIDFTALTTFIYGTGFPILGGLSLPISGGLNNKIKLKHKSFNLVVVKKITPSLFEHFWKLYPKKADKGKALTIWNKLCSNNVKERPIWSVIRIAIILQKETDRWKVRKFIPLPATWLNQSRWLDDPAEMITWEISSSTPTKTFVGYKSEEKLTYKEPIQV